MSVTFFSASANHKPKHELLPCQDCSFGQSETCIYCDGEGVIDTSCDPTVNLANSNAWAMLELIGIKFEYDGSIAPDLIPEIRRNIIRLINVKALRQVAESPATSPAGNTVPKLFFTGRDDEYIINTLRRLDEVLVYCQTHNECFLWG